MSLTLILFLRHRLQTCKAMMGTRMTGWNGFRVEELNHVRPEADNPTILHRSGSNIRSIG